MNRVCPSHWWEWIGTVPSSIWAPDFVISFSIGFFPLVLDSYLTCMHYQHSAEDLQSGGWVVVCMFLEFSVQLSPVPWTLIALVPLDSAQSHTWSAFQPHLCSPSLHSSSSLETPKAVSFANPKTDLIFPITLLCYLLSSAWKQYFFPYNLWFWLFQVRG